jgi:hypothetical protein
MMSPGREHVVTSKKLLRVADLVCDAHCTPRTAALLRLRAPANLLPLATVFRGARVFD